MLTSIGSLSKLSLINLEDMLQYRGLYGKIVDAMQGFQYDLSKSAHRLIQVDRNGNHQYRVSQ